MLWSSERVVLIASRQGEEYKPLGTGTVVAPGRILTAWHVIFAGDGKQRPDLVLRREGSASYVAAKVRWCGSADLDVAVLEADLDGGGSSHPMALLSGRDVDPSEAWEAQGYPKVWAENPSDRMEKVGGVTRSCSKGEKVLFLDAPTHPGVWGGLSGAAVVLAGKKQVVGVVRGVPHGWDGQRLSATPVAAFLDHPGFRDAIGLTPEDKRLDDDLSALETEVGFLMQKLPKVAASLASKLGLAPAAGNTAQHVAHTLVRVKSGKEVVMALNAVDDEMKNDPARIGERRAVKDLLWQVLPLATDWRPWALSGRATLSGGATFVDLPLGTLTMAEAVLAGIDRRSCRYLADSPEGPVGGAIINKPAVEHVALLDPGGKRLAEATVGLLAVELFNHAPDDLKRLGYDRLRRKVNEKLQYFHEAAGDERVPRWLLLDDEKLDHAGAADATSEERLAVAVAVLSKDLPHLRVLRLGDGIDGEVNLALHIGNMWRRGA